MIHRPAFANQLQFFVKQEALKEIQKEVCQLTLQVDGVW